MAKAVKMNMDEPDAVAEQILKSIRKGEKERHLGFPESFFVRINAILPGLVDRALRKQNRDARKHAEKGG
jgi:short-subunit dehydrogenase